MPNAAWLGAQHGAEIPYAFNWPSGTHSTQVAWTDIDRKLAGQVSAYWVNFATTGDPNGRNLPRWDAYQTKDDRAMGFADAPAMIPVPNQPALDFLDGFMQRSRATRSQN
jgi:para-nitrobenzyl esterase